MVEPIVKALMGFGVPGLVIGLLVWMLWHKDKQLQEEKAARIEDAEKMLTLILSLQKEVITAVSKLSDLVESWEKRESAREISELKAAAAARRAG